jgi:tetratricopeptide (TPR) repeat protein
MSGTKQISRFWALLAAMLLLANGALAQPQTQPPGRGGPPAGAQPAAPPATVPPQAQTQTQTLATLYERLKAAGSAQEAEVIVRQISRRWGRSGSDVSDLLMQRARQALAARNGPLAVELLDRIIALQPMWAEAWHVRGLAFFVMQDDGRALVDFRETLRREPQHFMALGMAAAALQRQGDERSALNAFKALQEMHPFFTGVKEAIERLKPGVEGRDA